MCPSNICWNKKQHHLLTSIRDTSIQSRKVEENDMKIEKQ